MPATAGLASARSPTTRSIRTDGSSRRPCSTSASRGRFAHPVYFASPRLSSLYPIRGGAMKYILLIQQGTTPTPNDPEAWAALSSEEQGGIYAAYQALNETAGVTAGVHMQPPELATTVRVRDGETLVTDGPFVELKEAVGGYL